VVLITEVWLVLRYRAKGDAEKLAKAAKWNPVSVSKASASWVKDRLAKGSEVPSDREVSRCRFEGCAPT